MAADPVRDADVPVTGPDGRATALVRFKVPWPATDGADPARCAVAELPPWSAPLVAQTHRRGGQWQVRAIGHGPPG